MSGTAKARLQNLLPHIDDMFATSHPDDAKELAQELREIINRLVNAKRRSGYDKHTNDSTGS